MRRFSKKRLQEVYYNSCSHEGYLNIYIYRKLSLRLAVVAAKLRMTPNQVTLISFLLSMAAVILFATGNVAFMLWALIPFHLGKILDCADGQLAALTDQRSKLGAFLDPFFDRVVDFAVLLALAIAYEARTASYLGVWLVLCFVTAWFFSAYLEKESGGEQKALDSLRETTKKSNPVIRKLLKWDGGFSGFITTLAIVFWQIPAFIILSLLVALIPIPIQFIRLYRELRAA